MGNRIQEIDPDGNIQTTQWLVQRALPTVITMADGATTRFYYDEHHGLARIVDPLGQSTLLKRDAFGQVVEEVDAAGNTRRRSITRPGRLSARRTVRGVSPVIAFTRSVGCSR
jgi:YD repeat-containing protein